MPEQPLFVVQAYRRKAGELRPADVMTSAQEDVVYRRGRAMAARVDGMVFYKIETSAAGDVWEKVELISTTGDVPAEAA